MPEKWRKIYNDQIFLQFWQIKQGLTANLISDPYYYNFLCSVYSVVLRYANKFMVDLKFKWKAYKPVLNRTYKEGFTRLTLTPVSISHPDSRVCFY